MVLMWLTFKWCLQYQLLDEVFPFIVSAVSLWMFVYDEEVIWYGMWFSCFGRAPQQIL